MATAQTLLAPVIQILQAEGSLNDVRYGQDLASRLQQQGKPLKVIAGQLQAKGLAASVVKDALQQVQGAALVDGGADLLAARAYVARRRLGFWRGDAACDYMQKDMGALARRGFSYQTAKRALQRTEIE